MSYQKGGFKLVDTKGNKQRAALTLGISLRQVNRLIKGYKEFGKAFFSHGNKGRKPVTAIPDETRKLVIDLYNMKYYDSNFSHYTELLEQYEDISLSVSTVSSAKRKIYTNSKIKSICM